MQFQATSEPSASVDQLQNRCGRGLFSPEFLRASRCSLNSKNRTKIPPGTASNIPVMMGVETPSGPVSFVVDSATERQRARFEASIWIQEALASRLFCLRDASAWQSNAGRGLYAESECSELDSRCSGIEGK
jgi:hypothetical protein